MFIINYGDKIFWLSDYLVLEIRLLSLFVINLISAMRSNVNMINQSIFVNPLNARVFLMIQKSILFIYMITFHQSNDFTLNFILCLVVLFPLVQLKILVVFCFSVNPQALRTEYQDEFALPIPSLSSETRRFWLDLFAVVFWTELFS